jgi:hypothetical protein
LFPASNIFSWLIIGNRTLPPSSGGRLNLFFSLLLRSFLLKTGLLFSHSSFPLSKHAFVLTDKKCRIDLTPYGAFFAARHHK